MLIIVVLTAAAVLLALLARTGPGRAGVLAAFVTGAMLVTVVVVMLTLRGHRSRRQAQQVRVATAAGLQAVPQPGQDFLEPFKHLPEVTGAATASNVLFGTAAGRDVVVFQSTYVIHTGQASIPVTHVIYACAAPTWPPLNIVPRRGIGRFAWRFGWRRGIELDDPRFNAAFRTTGPDEDFAIALIGPEMQRFMLTKPGVRWRIGGGHVHLIYRGGLKAERVPDSLGRLDGFWTHVPEELEAW